MNRAHARTGDPGTSHAAAEAIEPRINDLQIEVLAYAHQRPAGFTDEQLSVDFGDHTSTVRSRRSELTRAGLIVDSGRRTRLAGRKRHATIWIHRRYA